MFVLIFKVLNTKTQIFFNFKCFFQHLLVNNYLNVIAVPKSNTFFFKITIKYYNYKLCIHQILLVYITYFTKLIEPSIHNYIIMSLKNKLAY